MRYELRHSKKKRSGNSFVKGAALLAGAGFLVRLVGVFYRVPLMQIIGLYGTGLYDKVYPFYSFLLMFSTVGIPSAISKLVSEAMVRDDRCAAFHVFKVALRVLLCIGIVTMALMAGLHRSLASMIDYNDAAMSFLLLSPALLFVSLISVFRGFFQGLQNMKPTAMSQVIEQVIKVGIGLALAFTFNRSFGPAMGVAGAMLGVSISELLALGYLIFQYYRQGLPRFRRKKPVETPKTDRELIGRLLRLAVPILLASSVMSLGNLVDTVMVTKILLAGGLESDVALKQFGLLTTAGHLTNITSIFSMALSMSLIPSIADNFKRGEMEQVRAKAASGLKLSIALVMPAVAGLILLAEPILSLLYGRQIGAENMPIAVTLLQISSLYALLLSVLQTASGILQGLGRVRTPLISLTLGTVLKIIVNYSLVSIPAVGIYGAPVGTLLCYGTAGVINTIFVAKHTKMRFSVMHMVVKPLGATLGMGAGVALAQWLFSMFLPEKIALIPSIVLGICIYGLLALILGVVGDDELRYIPGGRRITSLVQKGKARLKRA